MSGAVKQFTSICRITLAEAVRQPICILLSGASVLIVMLLPFVLTHQFGEAGRLVRDSALSLHLVPGLFLSAFLACSVFHSDMRRGTVGVILCKPVNRSVFFAAKFAGVALIVAGFSICMICCTVLVSLAARETFIIHWNAELPLLVAFAVALLAGMVVNYVRRKPFPSVAFLFLCVCLIIALIVGVTLSGREGWHMLQSLLPAGVLILVACLIFSAIASCLALVFGVVPTVSICGAVFLAGLMMDYFYAVAGADSMVVRGLFYIVPNWQRFWVADAISGGRILPWRYAVMTVLYGLMYLGGVLCAGMVVFNKIELAKR